MRASVGERNGCMRFQEEKKKDGCMTNEKKLARLPPQYSPATRLNNENKNRKKSVLEKWQASLIVETNGIELNPLPKAS